MAQKGRGIFMVYVDIDAQHAPEFNKWCKRRSKNPSLKRPVGPVAPE